MEIFSGLYAVLPWACCQNGLFDVVKDLAIATQKKRQLTIEEISFPEVDFLFVSLNELILFMRVRPKQTSSRSNFLWNQILFW